MEILVRIDWGQLIQTPSGRFSLLSRDFTSSKEPLLVPDLDVLDYVREVSNTFLKVHKN